MVSFSRNIGSVTPNSNYFHYLKNYIMDQSIKKKETFSLENRSTDGLIAGTHNIVVPKLAVPFLRVRSISCGGMHSLALTTSGEVWQWGEPWGDFSMEINRSPKRLRISDVESVTSGAFHNLALTSTGNVYGWGRNETAQLGTGLGSYVGRPFLLEGLDQTVVGGAVGKSHSIVLTQNQEMWAVGSNKVGQCGIKSSMDPVPNFRKCVLDVNVVQVRRIAVSCIDVVFVRERLMCWCWTLKCSNRVSLFTCRSRVEKPFLWPSTKTVTFTRQARPSLVNWVMEKQENAS